MDGFDGEIFYYDTTAQSPAITQITNSADDAVSEINNGLITWYGYDGSDNEIYAYDTNLQSPTIVQITNNATNDRSPFVDSELITWYGDDGNDFEIFMASCGESPIVDTQPASIAIDYNASTTLSVVASGDGTLSYQWYMGTSGTTTSPIDGATSADYTTPNLKSDADFWVQITSEFGSVDSDTASVSINNTLVTEGFEDAESFAANWETGGKLGGEKIRCNTDTKTFSYAGECAWQFKGSDTEKTKLKWAQIFTPALRGADSLGAGDTVDLSLYAKANKSAAKLVVKIIALYTDTNKDKAKVVIGQTSGYELITNSLDIAKDVDRVKLIFVHKSKSSKVFLDEIAMSVSETPVLATDIGAIPLPDAPEGFRR